MSVFFFACFLSFSSSVFPISYLSSSNLPASKFHARKIIILKILKMVMRDGGIIQIFSTEQRWLKIRKKNMWSWRPWINSTPHFHETLHGFCGSRMIPSCWRGWGQELESNWFRVDGMGSEGDEFASCKQIRCMLLNLLESHEDTGFALQMIEQCGQWDKVFPTFGLCVRTMIHLLPVNGWV